MKTFRFTKKINSMIINAMHNNNKKVLDEVMALSTIQKCYGTKSKIYIFKNYIDENVYACYDDDKRLLTFKSEDQAIKFIFAIK